MSTLKNKKKIELGDWQTPKNLAVKVCQILNQKITPSSVIEPTCGQGNFLSAAIETFSSVKYFFGLDISKEYIEQTSQNIPKGKGEKNLELQQEDFFSFDWENKFKSIPQPILVIGNPPWVTNSEIGTIGGKNLPIKSNFQNMKGLDALTGKSNFDISEWMIISLIELLKEKDACLAMLCKTAVARKILTYCMKNNLPIEWSSIYKIDSKLHFEVAVDACLFVIKSGKQNPDLECSIYEDVNDTLINHTAAFKSNRLVCDSALFEKWKHLTAEKNEPFKWRSGIKHDCVKVMELKKECDVFVNGFDERLFLEEDYLYPMLKSSDLANGDITSIKRYMLVPQRFIGEKTSLIKEYAPDTWNYLKKYSELLDCRTSTIYKNNPQFSIFGVGDYSFTEWKIAISGFYKSLKFRLVPPYEGKPVVFDDTCYFLSCTCKEQAETLYELINSQAAKEFLTAYIWWDSKRPVTLEILNLLSLTKLAKIHNRCDMLEKSLQLQLVLF